jgi:hypothetical protein
VPGTTAGWLVLRGSGVVGSRYGKVADGRVEQLLEVCAIAGFGRKCSMKMAVDHRVVTKAIMVL